jgi:hypothetical protein
MRWLAFPINHGVDRSMGRVGVFFANLTVHSKRGVQPLWNRKPEWLVDIRFLRLQTLLIHLRE